MMQQLPPDSFTASRWRRFDLFETLGIPCRELTLIAVRSVLRPYAVGYCASEKIAVRPKADHTAVMFFRDHLQWCHLTNKEFAAIFEEAPEAPNVA